MEIQRRTNVKPKSDVLKRPHRENSPTIHISAGGDETAVDTWRRGTVTKLSRRHGGSFGSARVHLTTFKRLHLTIKWSD